MLFFYGFVEAVCQVLFARHLLSVFQGNEAVFGLVLACWLIFTACGVALVPESGFKSSAAAKLFPGLPVLCLLELILAPAGQHWLGFVPGTVLSFGSSAGIAIALLLPFCLYSGMIFRACVVAETEKGGQSLGQAYFWEALGMACGAMAFFVLLPIVDRGVALLPFLIAASFIPAWLQLEDTPGIQWSVLAVLLILCFWGYQNLPRAVLLSEKILFEGQKLIHFQDTPYGRLHVTENAGQQTIHLSQSAVASSNDEFHGEELLLGLLPHLPLHDSLRVFSFSGQSGTLMPAYRQWPGISHVEECFWSPDLASFFPENPDDSSAGPLVSSRHFGDPLEVVGRTSGTFDGIVWDLPAPQNLQMNRYYTTECFQSLFPKLRPGGVLVFTVEADENYVDKKTAAVLQSVWTSLGKVFASRTVLPGNRWVFVAGKGQAKVWSNADSLMSQLRRSHQSFRYLNAGFLPDRLADGRIRAVDSILTDPTAKENRRFQSQVPGSLRALWSQYHFPVLAALLRSVPARIAIIFTFLLAMLLVSISYGVRSRAWGQAWPSRLSVTILSFSVMSLQWILLAGLQIVSGNLYALYAVAATLFMLGTALGALLGNRAAPGRKWIGVLHGGMLLLLVACLRVITVSEAYLSDFVLMIFFSLCISASGFWTGFAFPLLSMGTLTNSRLWIYNLDLAGASMAALWVSLIAVPFWGFKTTLLVLIVLNVAPLANSNWRQKLPAR